MVVMADGGDMLRLASWIESWSQDEEVGPLYIWALEMLILDLKIQRHFSVFWIGSLVFLVLGCVFGV